MPRSANHTKKESKGPKKRTVFESSDENSDSEQNTQIREAATESLSTNIPVLVTNLVKYIINQSCNKYPIKRADMSKALNIPPKDFSEVFEKAQENLKNVYGIELFMSESKSGKLYMTCSLFQNSSFNAVSEEHRREGLILYIILSYVYMKGGEIKEKHVLQFIQELPMSLNYDEKEDYVSKLIKDTFTRQLYLKRTKIEIEGKNEAEIHLAWGPRAYLEFDKKILLKTVSDFMKKNPLNFATQYSEAFGEDEANETVMID